ncbi:alpha/beta fold hydrolase [Acinetobacter sp. A1]|uniref:alpha/beta fold hydrolase n=1 Tax=Acinetobacter sp. A1 TaxID=401467 RepID=UPI00144766DA|nr:alpha/beta fold hydrolase [Acinetobacter sp. A1]
MLLNYQITQNQPESTAVPLVFIHGLFGSLSNLGMLARAFQEQRTVIQLDVRNHGKSAHCDEMNYAAMAQDVLQTLDALDIQQFSVVGHSMGGKVAMTLAPLAAERLQQLVLLDICPFAYPENRHDQIFKALFAVQDAQVESRQAAMEIMRQHLNEEMVVQFLMKSFSKGQWLFNLNALRTHYAEILSWHTVHSLVDTLFIRGGNSPYIQLPEHFAAIEAQFPHAKIEQVAHAGHWLHAEKTAQVLEYMTEFLD